MVDTEIIPPTNKLFAARALLYLKMKRAASCQQFSELEELLWRVLAPRMERVVALYHLAALFCGNTTAPTTTNNNSIQFISIPFLFIKVLRQQSKANYMSSTI